MLGNDAMEFLKTLHYLDEIWKQHDDAEYNERQLTQFAERYHEHKLKLLGIADVVCSTWYATNQLRWKQKEVDMMDGTAMSINELQQMWQSDKGEQKWEAVPFVE